VIVFAQTEEKIVKIPYEIIVFMTDRHLRIKEIISFFWIKESKPERWFSSWPASQNAERVTWMQVL